jgi:rhamnosyltransferase
MVVPHQAQQVSAVIVTYQPDVGRLARLVECVSGQVSGIVVVDNGSSPPASAWLATQQACGTLSLASPEENLGIAAGQNMGIASARAQGMSHVLLLDQDSVPSPGMVDRLVTAEQELKDRGIMVAAVGPRLRDEHTDRMAGFAGLDGRSRKDVAVDGIWEVLYLVASGSLISLDALAEIGWFDEAFFIDYVDIDWGLRARQKQFRCFGVGGAVLRHNLGERTFSLMGGRYWIPIHNPLRNYYYFRNALALYQRTYTPLLWIMSDVLRLALRFTLNALFVPPRLKRIRMMALGIAHGIGGSLGPWRGDA